MHCIGYMIKSYVNKNGQGFSNLLHSDVKFVFAHPKLREGQKLRIKTLKIKNLIMVDVIEDSLPQHKIILGDFVAL